MAYANHHRNVDFWRFADTCARFYGSNSPLHSILGATHVHLGYFRILSRQRGMLT